METYHLKFSILRSVVASRLCSRDPLKTLYHVAPSSLHLQSEHPTIQPSKPLYLRVDIHPSAVSKLNDPSPCKLSANISRSNLSLVPSVCSPSSHLFLDQRPWLIPPWISKILSAPPPWLVPPVPNELATCLSLIFLKLQPWIVPP